MDVRIDAARRQYLPFSGKYLRGRPDLHSRRHAVHDARISRLADSGDLAVANGKIGLVDSGVVENQGVGDHQIGSASGAGCLGRLSHAVADHLAAAELDLVAVDRTIFFNLDDQSGVSKTDAISGGRAVVLRVALPVDPHLTSAF